MIDINVLGSSDDASGKGLVWRGWAGWGAEELWCFVSCGSAEAKDSRMSRCPVGAFELVAVPFFLVDVDNRLAGNDMFMLEIDGVCWSLILAAGRRKQWTVAYNVGYFSERWRRTPGESIRLGALSSAFYRMMLSFLLVAVVLSPSVLECR